MILCVRSSTCTLFVVCFEQTIQTDESIQEEPICYNCEQLLLWHPLCFQGVSSSDNNASQFWFTNTLEQNIF